MIELYGYSNENPPLKPLFESLKSLQGEAKDLRDIIRKSSPNHEGLVRKKVTVKLKNGMHYQAYRWVNPETGESPTINHSKNWFKKHHKDGTSGEETSAIHHVVHNVDSKTEILKRLIGLGVYEPKILAKLSGLVPFDARLQLDNAGINWEKFEEESSKSGIIKDKEGEEISDLAQPLPNLPVEGAIPLDTPENQKLAISEIQAEFGAKVARMEQEKLRKVLVEKYQITVKDKWNAYEDDLDMLINGDLGLRAVMAYGNGGIGKTFTFESIICPKYKMNEYERELDMEKNGEEYQYVKIGGKIGSRETQRALYEHRNKIVVFDDCDSIWADEGLINVLKNVLDTSGRGKCQWSQKLPPTSKNADDEVPASYIFKGRMVFITNLSKKELNDRGAAPLSESRCASTDLTMNMEQTLERLEEILPHINLYDANREKMQDILLSDKVAALNALKEVAPGALIEQLNTRVLTGIIATARKQRRVGGEYDHVGLVKTCLKQFGML